MYSKKWNTWKSVIDLKTCLICRKNHGKIFSIYEDIYPKPPIHENCRCEIRRLQAILAGDATDDGMNGADWYLKYYKVLPDYYISKEDAKLLGWVSIKGNLNKVAPGYMITAGIFNNDEGKLPQENGRIWYEADINYKGGYRNGERILFSNDGLLFVTYDHYRTFIEIQ